MLAAPKEEKHEKDVAIQKKMIEDMLDKDISALAVTPMDHMSYRT